MEDTIQDTNVEINALLDHAKGMVNCLNLPRFNNNQYCHLLSV